MLLAKRRNQYLGLSKSRFDLEKELEELIFKTSDLKNIFGEEILIIGHQVEFVGIDDKIDFLAINKEGDLIIIETKRSFLSATDSTSQISRYASFVALWSLRNIKDLFENYRFQKSKARANFESEMNKFLNVDLSQINEKQRLVLVGSAQNKKLASSCRWLIEQGVDIELIKIEKYKSDFHDNEYFHIEKIDFSKEVEVFPPKIENEFDKEHHLRSSDKEIKELVGVFVETIKELYEFDGPYWDKQTFAYFKMANKKILVFRVNKSNIYVETINPFLSRNPVEKRQLIRSLNKKIDFDVEERVSFKF